MPVRGQVRFGCLGRCAGRCVGSSCHYRLDSSSVEDDSSETRSGTHDEPDGHDFLDPNDKSNDSDVREYFLTSSKLTWLSLASGISLEP